MELDLKDPAETARLLELVTEVDVLLQGFRPGVAERLGIGAADCLACNPRLVYGRMTACVTPVFSLAESGTHPQLRDRTTHVVVDGVEQIAPAPASHGPDWPFRPRRFRVTAVEGPLDLPWPAPDDVEHEAGRN